MYITRHSNVTDQSILDSFWELYDASYAKLSGLDPSREKLFRHEFNEVMADPTYRTTILHADDSTPIGMAVSATDIAATRYLSRQYFEQRYPDRMREGRIHYVMWIVVHPEHQATSALWKLAEAGFAPEFDEGALLVFDLPESNQPGDSGGAAELIHRVARRSGDVTLEPLSVNRYYALDFAPAERRSPVPPRQADELEPSESEVESTTSTA